MDMAQYRLPVLYKYFNMKTLLFIPIVLIAAAVAMYFDLMRELKDFIFEMDDNMHIQIGDDIY
jgi:hypothetical protein